MSIDHIGLYVPASIYKETVDWYLAALAPLGFKKFVEPNEYACGLGVQRPDFWIACHQVDKANIPLHIGFKADNRKVIDEFHKAALAAGGKDNGAPGLRPQYHLDYYGAFVIDPSGNNVEVVCHMPEATE
ncbi:glyoxalase/bleomycin resistance protein/dioxygenase [Colletotrichum abscissum]|uniref:Glyoxalase/bleomycin resistance protein/dioxygenase n=1 Tax=Colletotrichum abscissum TaxID=1671311 RepID=A0A9Q0B9Z5_9PEZI|nr:glyoxalase/bleomycin resistance protein/dioxygenase [Colletotrichum abscissum]KAI3559068.1 glyoxalase/bleomycin resistance protein/dioxygenase [Colletotrichum abscissum]KAK1484942.1 glyoxalase/bleomycin resistance protein/dioxygenase [Colletotrichum abscissum]